MRQVASSEEAACKLGHDEGGGGTGSQHFSNFHCGFDGGDTTCDVGPYSVLPTESRTSPTTLLSPLLSLTGDPSICSISNPDFVLYSSVVSFYLPFGVTVLVYARIYVVLRQRRRKRILTRQNSQCLSVRPSFPQQVSILEQQKEDTASRPVSSSVHFCLLCPSGTHICHLLTCRYWLGLRWRKSNLNSALIVFPRPPFLGLFCFLSKSFIALKWQLFRYHRGMKF